MQQTPIHFMTVREQAELLASGEITSVALTRHFLDRAAELDPPPFELPSEPRSDHDGMLSTMVTIARDHALESAERADAELRSGRRRSILHGLPYGVKDLLDTDGIRTTWGSGIFRDRVPNRNAAVIDRLADAGAVLMAKMSLGEFAGGNTSSALNPWKLDRTSFGSSSGTVSAAVAGLIGFGIGTETGGSIVFPGSAVGASGLRPTFSRVSRFGCMPLSWSLDKIGPVGRSAEDCGHVLEQISAFDERDNSSTDRPFSFRVDPGSMRGKRLGVHRREFLLTQSDHNRQVFQEALDTWERMGVIVEDIELPLYPTGALFTTIVTVESGTIFEPLFTDGSAAGMFSFNEDRAAGWMAGRMMSASDYLTAQRIRSQLTREADAIVSRYDAVIAPTWPNGAGLREVSDGWPIPARNEWEPPEDADANTPRLNYIANLVGHPGLNIPCGFDPDGMPLCLQIVAGPFDDQTVLDFGMSFQAETDWHLRRPPYPWRP
jgi:Asp-tRNA(Asn)/Glu-tRNA(Gln) amidotransferase A subunit family amidase